MANPNSSLNLVAQSNTAMGNTTAVMLSIKQINLHHSKGATALVGKSLRVTQTNNLPLIYLIQEPWTRNCRVMGFDQDRTKLFYHRSTKNPRSCIAVTGVQKVTFLPQLSDSDVTTILVNINKDKVIFSSIYLGHDSTEEVPGDMVKSVIKHSQDNNIPLIIGGDANAHHIVWGSTDINLRGERLLEYISSTNLEILNKGTSPTFVTRGRAEVLDITLASPNISKSIKGWHVSPEETLSDHREIVFQLEREMHGPVKFRNPRNTNWEMFRAKLKPELDNLLSACNELRSRARLDDVVEKFNDAIIKSYHSTCPEKAPSNPKNKWWNSELSRLRRQSRRLLRLYLARKDTPEGPACYEILRRSRNKYTKEIVRARNSYFQKFLSRIEGAKTTSRLHKLLSNDPLQGPGILRKPDGTYTVSPEETAELLLKTHFPDNVRGEVTNHPAVEDTTSVTDLTPDLITLSMVEWAIFSFEPFKSPGFDGILPAFLQKTWDVSGEILKAIYRASLRFGYIPKAWQKVKITFIPKPGKEDYTSPKSFRPISLTSFLLKGMEKIIDRRVREKLSDTNTLLENQHAFRKGSSTETALHSVVSQAEKAIANKEYMLSAFLDIEGAFDNISFDAINRHILDCGVDPPVRKWISFMLSHRTICYANQGVPFTVTAMKGTPQGGVLSPLLWIIVMNSLLMRLRSRGFSVTGYADDLNINCIGKYISTLSERLQLAIQVVETWCLEVGLSVNPSKSELIIFTNKRNFEGFRNPILFGQVIQRKYEVKYLGIILDSKLNWRKHIEYKVNKCLRIFWSCRTAIGRSWGLSPKCIRWLYTAIVRPTLAYGSFVWWQGTKTASTRMKLNHLQRVACLNMTGAMSTTPQAALDVLLQLPRLEDFIEAEAMKTAYRLQPNSGQSCRGSHIDSLGNITKLDPLLGFQADWLPKPQFMFDRSFEIIIAKNLEEFVRIHEWADACFFTDASIRAEGGGIAVFNELTNTVKTAPFGLNATIKQLEITAISHCAEEVSCNIFQKNVAIFTDSLAAARALAKCEINSKIVLECRNYLQIAAVNNQVKLVWIKSHSNIPGNELADTHAKTAASRQALGPEPFLPIDYSRARGATNRWLLERRRLNWQGVYGCEHAKMFIDKFDSKLIKQLLWLNKPDLRIATGLLTGHAKVNNHLQKMGIRDDPDCRLCGRDVETTAHLICDCLALANARLAIMGKAKILPMNVDSIRKLLNLFEVACNESPSLCQVFGARH